MKDALVNSMEISANPLVRGAEYLIEPKKAPNNIDISEKPRAGLNTRKHNKSKSRTVSSGIIVNILMVSNSFRIFSLTLK